jgi:lysophospholipase L1-like esterase
MKNFAAYIALGDSMSIDLYPALDRDQPTDTPLGAAALLYSNNDEFWPEFQGRDLASKLPPLDFINLCEDGATTWDLLEGTYVEFVKPFSKRPVLITITIGGNDALGLVGIESNDPDRLTSAVADILARYQKILATIRNTFSDATVVLNTIYDPTDGKGVLRSDNFADKLPFLRYLNDQIRAAAKTNDWLLADIYQHFLGHGLSAPPAEQWYWQPNPIEPSARGASELRRLWLQALGIV